MTVSKPKTSTILSIVIFSIPMLGMGIYGFNHLLNNPEWYHYAMAVIGTPIGLGLLFRQLLSYKTLGFGKGKLQVKFLLKPRPAVYSLTDLEYWKESITKTATGTYKEIEMKWPGKKQFNMSTQEYSNYDKALKYLKKSASKKFVG